MYFSFNFGWYSIQLDTVHGRFTKQTKSVKLSGPSHIKFFYSLCQYDAKLQTCHPCHPVPFTSKCQILLKINAYNFKYKISVGNIMKLFFLSDSS